MATLLFTLAGAIFVGGAILFGTAKEGEQQSLGGVVAAISLLIAALGALARVAGYAFLLVLVDPAFGRDDGHYAQSPLKPWFDSLKSGKGPCCSDADGSVVQDADWESKDGRYRVKLEGTWYDVPDDAVLKEPNRAGRTMVWPIYYRSMGKLDRVEIRCFIPGSMT